MIARQFFLFRKYRYFNSLSDATHPIRIHTAVLEKLSIPNQFYKVWLKTLLEIWLKV